MAFTFRLAYPLPLPTPDEVAALAVAGSYLTRAGTQLTSRLLGCPNPDGEAAMLADLSDNLLGTATLCAVLLELAEQDPQ